MQSNNEFSDLLEKRRKDCDFLWVSRPMDPLLPHLLPPELKLSRSQTINAVLNTPRVKEVISDIANQQNVYQYIVKRNAYAILQEMASKAYLPTVRWLGFIITKALKKMFRSIYINESMIFDLRKQMCSYQVQYIYVPSHRSYLDFILLSYILFSYDMSLPNIASGMDFYQMRIVGELLRKTGAFYMRRSFSNDPLYKELFKAYVSFLVDHNDRAIEFFIEGTRSRSQKSIVPKYGLLSIILESYLQGNVPDIQFLPISISYNRPPEEMLFVYELLGVPKPKESTIALLRSLSILKNPGAHGSVFFNITKPISASQYVTSKHRKSRVMDPDYKLPTTVIENLAYDIINTHQENTVLTTFNIIALLFNERVQTYPGSSYTLETLIEDYRWFTSWLSSLGATIHPTTENMNADELNREILESLKTHSELLTFDESNMLSLKSSNIEMNSEKYTNVKGHTLNKRTMAVAVPTINLTIYVNPVLFFLAKLGIVTATIGLDSIHIDKAFEQYVLLRKVLSTEFALPLKASSSTIDYEWKKSIDILTKEGCLHIQGNTVTGRKTTLFSLLHNLIIPFIDAVCFTCTTLLHWDESVLGTITNQKVLKECQKQVEIALFEETKFRPHPYCLSLDLFNSTFSNLLQQGIIITPDKYNTYLVDRVQMAHLITQLRQLPLLHPLGSYVDISSLLVLPTSVHMQAKL
ncbi:hypothetical protein KPH14_005632 [Odynerus spinipes]|uniref:Phospholipid/glycerol acyltransferase domain-containing protein n=1 Tax=Odynerus spinipes TaxID=1348599 RepID=A0AAD9RAT9_9HYME|nr:hypothetical protein KPH14_005632 [Odynerus spinipes]